MRIKDYQNNLEELQKKFKLEFDKDISVDDIIRINTIFEDNIKRSIGLGCDRIILPTLGSFQVSKTRILVEKALDNFYEQGYTKEEAVIMLDKLPRIKTAPKQNTKAIAIKFNKKTK